MSYHSYLKTSSKLIGVLFCSLTEILIILNSTLLITTLSFVVGTKVKSPADIVKILSCDSIRSFTSDLFTLFKEPLIVVSEVVSVIAPVVVLYDPAVTCLIVTSPPSLLSVFDAAFF